MSATSFSVNQGDIVRFFDSDEEQHIGKIVGRRNIGDTSEFTVTCQSPSKCPETFYGIKMDQMLEIVYRD